jgi:hypothetical protein
MVNKDDLMQALAPDAQARELTAHKTATVVNGNPSWRVTGFVVTSADGTVGVIDKSACRWFGRANFWKLMHE